MPFIDVIWDLADDSDGNVQHIAEHGLTPALLTRPVPLPCDAASEVLEIRKQTEVLLLSLLKVAAKVFDLIARKPAAAILRVHAHRSPDSGTAPPGASWFASRISQYVAPREKARIPSDMTTAGVRS